MVEKNKEFVSFGKKNFGKKKSSCLTEDEINDILDSDNILIMILKI